jgi:hypothetical protein
VAGACAASAGAIKPAVEEVCIQVEKGGEAEASVDLCRSFDCVRLITPPSKDRSLGTPMTPDFAQDDERRTDKSEGRSRFLASLGMTKSYRL